MLAISPNGLDCLPIFFEKYFSSSAMSILLASISSDALQKAQKIMLYYLIKVILHCFVFIFASKATFTPFSKKKIQSSCVSIVRKYNKQNCLLMKHLNWEIPFSVPKDFL